MLFRSAEYDALWQRVRSSFAAVVRRDAKYLDWKYLRCPFRQYNVCEARRRGELTGFAVTRQEGDASFRRGVIVDLFCDTSDAVTQDALIDAAESQFRSGKFVRAETYTQHAGLGARFRRHGFRPGRTAIQYCVAHRHASPAPMARSKEFGLMLGDGDLDRA